MFHCLCHIFNEILRVSDNVNISYACLPRHSRDSVFVREPWFATRDCNTSPINQTSDNALWHLVLQRISPASEPILHSTILAASVPPSNGTRLMVMLDMLFVTIDRDPPLPCSRTSVSFATSLLSAICAPAPHVWLTLEHAIRSPPSPTRPLLRD